MKKISTQKLITIIIASVLVAALIFVVAMLLIKNIGETTLKIESKTAIPGDEISLPIIIDKNHGVFSGQIVITYNSSALEFLSCENGKVFDECNVHVLPESDAVVIIAEQTSKFENTKIDGVLATLKFKVRAGAKKGTYPVSFHLPETVEEGTYFLRVQDIDLNKWTVPKCTNGKIVVQ